MPSRNTTDFARDGIAWLRTQADNADTQAQAALGCERGRGMAVNLEEAARWYLASAEQGIGPAMKNLSNMYRDGRGVEQDIQQAIRWLRNAEADGCG